MTFTTKSKFTKLALITSTALITALSAGGQNAFAACTPAFTAGNDVITCDASTTGSVISRNGGDDTVTVNGATLVQVQLDDGSDTVVLNDTYLSSWVDVGYINGGSPDGANDRVTLRNGSSIRYIYAGAGNDTIILESGSTVRGGISFANGQIAQGVKTFILSGASSMGTGFTTFDANDVVNLSGASTIGGSINLAGGNDQLTITGGSEVNGHVNMGDGIDTVTVSGANSMIDGSLTTGDGADTVTLTAGAHIDGFLNAGEGNDVINMNASTVRTYIYTEEGNDTVSVVGGSVGSYLSTGEGTDTVTLNGTEIGSYVDTGFNNSNDGIDTVNITNTTIASFVETGYGNDILNITGGSVGSYVNGEDGNDVIGISNADIATHVYGGNGNDRITINNGSTLGYSVYGNNGEDVIVINGATTVVSGDVFAGNDDDIVTISGGATVGNTVNSVGVDLGNGDDVVNLNGTVNGYIQLGNGEDAITLDANTVINTTSTYAVYGSGGIDAITVNGGTYNGISGGNDNDIITVNGGSVSNISADAGDDTVNLYGGVHTNLFLGSGNDTLLVDESQSAAQLDLTAISTFNGNTGTDTATFVGVTTGQELVDNVSFSSIETITFQGSNINIDDSSYLDIVNLTQNTVLTQIDGDLNLGYSTDLTVDGTSRINMQDGATDDIIRSSYVAGAGSVLAIDVDVVSRGLTADSDYIIGNDHTPTMGALVNVNILGNADLSGSRRVVDGGADILDPGVGATVEASAFYTLQNDPSTGARRYWLQDSPNGGTFLVWTTPISGATTSALFGGGVASGGAVSAAAGMPVANDPDYKVDLDTPGASAATVVGNAGAMDAIGDISSMAAAGAGGFANTNQSCARGERLNAWIAGGLAASEFNSTEGSSRNMRVGIERDLGDLANASCGRIAVGAFAYFGQSDLEMDLGATQDIKSKGAGAFVRASTPNGVYGALTAHIGENETDAVNTMLESTSNYNANTHGVAVTLGKVSKLSQDVNFDIRAQAYFGESDTDTWTDSNDLTIDSIAGKSQVYHGTLGLDKTWDHNKQVFGRIGAKRTAMDNNLRAYFIDVSSRPAYTTATGELGFKANIDNKAIIEIGAFGETGSDVQNYGARARVSVKF